MRLIPRIGWAVAFLFSLIPLSTRAQELSHLKVLSLNFNSEDVPTDSHNVLRDLRFQALRRWIRENDADVVLIQEGWNCHDDPSVAITLARDLDYDVAYRLGEGFPGYLQDSNAILTKKSLQMANERDLKLPHSGFELGDGKHWVLAIGRASWAVGVRARTPEGPVFIYSTHLIGADANERADQLRAIEADVESRAAGEGITREKTRVILGGDFNLQPFEAGPAQLNRAGYTDSFDFAHPGDPSCTDCADPTQPFFNPISIGAGLVPSQAGETTSQRDDYIFSRGPALKTISSTLVFTAPYGGVWLSDHYGTFTVFGSDFENSVPSPAHDHEEDIPNPESLKLSHDHFFCADTWPGESDVLCTHTLEPQVVRGPRGYTVKNDSGFYVEVDISGPGPIFTSPRTGLAPGESVAFTFLNPGEYHVSIWNSDPGSTPYQAQIMGALEVQAAGN